MSSDGVFTRIRCDIEGCKSLVELELPYLYAGRTAYPDDSEATIEKMLERDEWVVNGENHYCCAEHCPR